MTEQVIVKNAIYLSGKVCDVSLHLRTLLSTYGDIAVIDLIKLLQQ